MPDDARQITETEFEPTATATEMADENDFVPTTEFGRRLLALRQRIISSGQGLATEEEFERELAERRGGVYAGEDE